MPVSCGPFHWLWVIFAGAAYSGICIFFLGWTAMFGISGNDLVFPSLFLTSKYSTSCFSVSHKCHGCLLPRPDISSCLCLKYLDVQIFGGSYYLQFIIVFNKCVFAYWLRGHGNWQYVLLLPTKWNWWTKVKLFIISSRTHLGILWVLHINAMGW